MHGNEDGFAILVELVVLPLLSWALCRQLESKYWVEPAWTIIPATAFSSGHLRISVSSGHRQRVARISPLVAQEPAWMVSTHYCMHSMTNEHVDNVLTLKSRRTGTTAKGLGPSRTVEGRGPLPKHVMGIVR